MRIGILFAVLLHFVFVSPVEAVQRFGGQCSLIFPKGEIRQYSGEFSRPEQIKEHEARFKGFAKEEMDIDLPSGGLSTEVLRFTYQDLVKIAYEWGTPDNKDFILASLFVSESQIEASSKEGLHPIHIYREQEFLDHIEAMKFLSEVPDHDFVFSSEMSKSLNRRLGKNVLPMAQWVAKNFSSVLRPLGVQDLLFKGDGSFRKAITRLPARSLTEKQIENMLGLLDEFVSVGLFKESQTSEEMKKAYSILPYHWSKLNRKPTRNADGTLDLLGSFPSSKILESAMEDLNRWTNEEIGKHRRGDSDARDPIEIAAIHQLAMVYLHPFPDGNGRTSKWQKNKILDMFGLPPDVRRDNTNEHDLDMGLKAFVESVREGVFYSLQLMGKIEPSKPPSILDAKVGIEVSRSAIAGLSKVEKRYYANNALPSVAEEVLTVGKTVEKDLIFRGGFFQGRFGVLWQYLPEENRLYPLNDWVATLYGLGGDLYVKDTGKNKYIFRMPNPSFSKNIENNLKLFRGLVAHKMGEKENAIDSRSVEVIPFETLLDVNEGFGKFRLLDHQKDLIRDALSTKLDPTQYPIAVLAASRGNHAEPARSGPTELQYKFTYREQEYNAGTLMGAYQSRRLYLLKLEQDIREQNPELYEGVQGYIETAKKDAYIAARTLLKPVADFLREVFEVEPGESKDPRLTDAEFHRWARGHAFYKGMWAFVERQEWAYDSYAEAVAKVDQNRVAVIRNISDLNLKAFGLLTEVQQAEVLRKWLPFVEGMVKRVDQEIKIANKERRPPNPKNLSRYIDKLLIKFVAEVTPEGEKKPEKYKALRKKLRDGIDKAVEGVFAGYYDSRGEEVEMARPFVDLALHLYGHHPQEMKSTTTNPYYNIFLNSQNQLKFYPGGKMILYDLEINTEAIDAVVSPYVGQSESMDRSRLGRFKVGSRIIFQATENQLKLTQLSGNETGKFSPSWWKKVGSMLANVFRSEETKLQKQEELKQKMAAEAALLEPYGLKTYQIFLKEFNVYVKPENLVPESTPTIHTKDEFVN